MLFEIADALTPAHQVFEIAHRFEIARVKREKEQRRVQGRIGHCEPAGEKEILALKLGIDHPRINEQLLAVRSGARAHLGTTLTDELFTIRRQLGIAGGSEKVGNDQQQNRSEKRIVGPLIDNLAQA